MAHSSPGPAGVTHSGSGPLGRSRWWLAVPTLGGTCLVLIALALVVYMVVQGCVRQEEPEREKTEEATSPAATSVGPEPTDLATAVSCEVLIGSDQAETIASLPVTLTIGGSSFAVDPVLPIEGNWRSPESPDEAIWVCGTIVNYVLELGSAAANRALLDGIGQGAQLGLGLANGTFLLFRVDVARSVGPDLGDLTAQTRPRLTVLTREDDGSWQALIADYVSGAEASRPPVTAVARVGESVRVDDLLLTVVSAGAVREGVELEPETMVFLVEYAVENVGTDAWRTDRAAAQLQDGAGNRYLMSPAASAMGEFGALVGGEIDAGATARASAGYIVPQALSGPALIWTFTPRTDSTSRANVIISYESGAVSIQADEYAVSITDVFLNMRGDVLHVEGEITNVGERSLTLGVSDIILTSSAGLADLHLAAPPLPWTVEPGQTQVVELQFARPNAPAALLTVRGYSFEIQGLQ